jgi:serine/threonine-protein kinase
MADASRAALRTDPAEPGAFDEDEQTQKVGWDALSEGETSPRHGAEVDAPAAVDAMARAGSQQPAAVATGRSLAEEDDDDEPTAVASASSAARRTAVRSTRSGKEPSPPVAAMPARGASGDGPVPPGEEASPPAARIGRYDVVRRLAYGGMAEVFLARETTAVGVTRLVAIKRVLPHIGEDPTFVEMFLDEARIAVMLSHPNICHLYAVEAAGASSFLVMEYVDGLSLAELIVRARGRSMLPVDVVVRVAAHVADALHYAHVATDEAGRQLNIVHRDVSPSNIMLGRDGRVKLLDFGVAKARTHATKTRSGVVKGKFAYMAPQQCLGHPVDGRADVFALGICLWEALAGRALFQRDTEYATMSAVLQDPVPSLRLLRPDVPDDLEAIVRRALAKQPDQRFQSALEFQLALEGWLSAHAAFVTASHIAELVRRVLAGEPAMDGRLDAGSTAADVAPVPPDGMTPKPQITPQATSAAESPAGGGVAPEAGRTARPDSKKEAPLSEPDGDPFTTDRRGWLLPVVVIGAVGLASLATWLLNH